MKKFQILPLLNLSFYLGPKVLNDVKGVSSVLVDTLNYGWLSIISKPMLYVLNFLNDKTGNYGIAIILLTILIKLLLLPFTLSGGKKMKKNQDFQKKMAYLKQKYKNDKVALNRESAELVKKHGISGMAGGCLPSLLNLPILIGLQRVLVNAIQLYGVRFLWIPNLSQPDPYYILGIFTILAMMCTSMGEGLKGQVMKVLMALIIGGVTMYLSAGLALFILLNIGTGVLQTSVQNRFSK